MTTHDSLGSDDLDWHADADIVGVHVRVRFDAEDAPAEGVAQACVTALSAVLPDAELPRLAAEGRAGYVVGDLQAFPDAVFEHGCGLISLCQRGGERERHDPSRWPSQLRLDAMLQCIVTAMAVSGQTQRPAVPMLRVANALYLFGPSPAVLECLASHIGAARRYAGEPGRIGPQQLVTYCEPRVRALPVACSEPAAPAVADFADTVPSAAAVVTR